VGYVTVVRIENGTLARQWRFWRKLARALKIEVRDFLSPAEGPSDEQEAAMKWQHREAGSVLGERARTQERRLGADAESA